MTTDEVRKDTYITDMQQILTEKHTNAHKHTHIHTQHTHITHMYVVRKDTYVYHRHATDTNREAHYNTHAHTTHTHYTYVCTWVPL